MHVRGMSRLLSFRRPRRIVPTQMAYELWAPTYPATAHNPLMRAEQQIVELLLRDLRPGRALDVGTGSGRYLPVLAATGARAVVGLDFSRAMLAQASRRWPRIRGDARRLPFRRGAFDIVNASLMAGDVDDLAAWLREISSALARGGHLLYSDFHPSWARRGWRRTFQTSDGRTLDLPFAAHSIADHLSALDAAGLEVLAIREPHLADDGDPAVAAFRRRWGNAPVVVVFHATKNGPVSPPNRARVP